MAKALIIYSTRAGQTRKIAELIAEGMRIGGLEVDIKDATGVSSVDDLAGYEAYALGSATYHGEMMGAMKTLLFLAEKAGLQGKVGGSFGAFGWSGEASDRIFNTMRHVLEMNVVGGALRLKSAALDGAVPMAQDYGKEIAAKVAA